jgi:hemerythrin-like domain-containing protein
VCGYCGCRAITVIGQLSAEHDAIVNAAGALQRAAAGGDVVAARAAAARVGDLLAPHTAREELGLFAELRRDAEFTVHVDALYDEHDELEALLGAVAAGDLPQVPALVDLLRRHIDHEEHGLFPAAAVALDGSAWERVVAADVQVPA